MNEMEREVNTAVEEITAEEALVEEVTAEEALVEEVTAEETMAPMPEQLQPAHPTPTTDKSWLQTMYELMGNVAVAILLVTLLLGFCFRQVVVDGDSMNDTLTHKDRLLLQTMFYTASRGDIVVIYQEDEPEKPLIKRVIATGGDAVKLDVTTSEVYLKKAGENDWELLEEPYVHYSLGWGIAWDDDNEIVVPQGEVFVLGDHRDASRDSRAIGCVKEENIVGGVLLRLFPFSGLGGLQ